MSFETRAHLQSGTQGQIPNNPVAVVLFELLDDLEKLAQHHGSPLPTPSPNRPTYSSLDEPCALVTYQQVLSFVDSNTQVEPLDALIFFVRRITRPRTTNPAKMASGPTSPYLSAPNTAAANAYEGTPGQGSGIGAGPPIQSMSASPPICVPNPPAVPAQSAAPTYGGMPGQEYGSDAGARVQPQGYGPGFTGSIDTHATQTPGRTATVGPFTGQDFAPAGTQHSTHPAPPVNQPQVQATPVPFKPRGKKWTQADYDEVRERMNDSSEIEDVALLRPSHTPGAPTPPMNQSTGQAPPEFCRADADTVARALREARETVGKVDTDALSDILREMQK